MVPAALVPSLVLLGGVVAGINLEMPWRLVVWVVPLLTMAAASAWQCRFGRTCFVLVAATFGCCGFVLGSHAREQALGTPLKAAVTEVSNSAFMEIWEALHVRTASVMSSGTSAGNSEA